MRIRHTTSSGQDKVELQMTPMIDIVFQLIAFFVMTLKIASVEGDFNIKMPLAAPAAGPSSEILPPLKVRLTADAAGELAGIRLGERALPNFAALNQEIRGLVGAQTGPGALADAVEVELDCDYQLKYAYIIDAISAVSGYVAQSGGQRQIVRLVEKIKFAPPRQAPAGGA